MRQERLWTNAERRVLKLQLLDLEPGHGSAAFTLLVHDIHFYFLRACHMVLMLYRGTRKFQSWFQDALPLMVLCGRRL